MCAPYRLRIVILLLAITLLETPYASACGRRARRCRRMASYPCDYYQPPREYCPPPLAISDKGLRWRFEIGKTFYQEMTTDTDQIIQIQDNQTTNKQKQSFVYSYTPKGRDADGNWLIVQRIEAVKMDFDTNGSRISYDSTTNEMSGSFLDLLFTLFTGNSLKASLKALVGSEFLIVVDKNGRPLRVEGSEANIERVRGKSPQMASVMKEMMNKDSWMETASSAFTAIPDRNLALRDSWERGPFKMDMGPIGLFEINYRYTYDGIDRVIPDLHRIAMKTDVKYRAPGRNAGGLPFKIVNSYLQTTRSDGVILFNSAKGRMESSESETELKGKLKIEIAGMITPVDLTQTQKTTIKNMDKNPTEPAKKSK
jgi:hypothetical protein